MLLWQKVNLKNINKIEYAMLSTLFGGKLNIKEFNKLYNVDLEKLLKKSYI